MAGLIDFTRQRILSVLGPTLADQMVQLIAIDALLYRILTTADGQQEVIDINSCWFSLQDGEQVHSVFP